MNITEKKSTEKGIVKIQADLNYVQVNYFTITSSVQRDP